MPIYLQDCVSAYMHLDLYCMHSMHCVHVYVYTDLQIDIDGTRLYFSEILLYVFSTLAAKYSVIYAYIHAMDAYYTYEEEEEKNVSHSSFLHCAFFFIYCCCAVLPCLPRLP